MTLGSKSELEPDRMGRIAIFTDNPGWHGARLREAFAKRGFESEYVSLTECRIFMDSNSLPVIIPGFEETLPHGVFVRGVPGGSLEEVVHYLDVLHALKSLGITVYNDGRAIEKSVDKAMTSFLLHQANIPTPPTWVTCVRDEASRIAEREISAGHKLISKPVFGSQGEGLQRIDGLEEIPRLTSSNGVFYLQRFVQCGDDISHDWRIFVINGKARSAMRRCGSSWLNNVAQGARCEQAVLNTRFRQLAELAVNALQMNYGGVDIIRDVSGRHSIIEVNSIPAWKGLQSVCQINIAELLAEDFLSRCNPPCGSQVSLSSQL